MIAPNNTTDTAHPTKQLSHAAKRGGAKTHKPHEYVIEAVQRPATMPAAIPATHSTAV